MLSPSDPSASAGEIAALPLIRRLAADYGRAYWPRYAFALACMAIAAACTALAAYLFGDVINNAYIHKNYQAIVVLSFTVMGLFIAKGFATYGQAVTLARIANRIIADSQRRLFARLLAERVDVIAERHSSEFAARLTAGASAAAQVLNLLVSAFGRDFLTLAGLLAVMIYQDPLLTLIGLVVAPPALLLLRKLTRRARNVAHSQFVGGARILETLQELLQGMRVVKAFSLEAVMRERADRNIAEVEAASNKMARVANRSSPLMETLGGVAIAIVLLYSGYRVVQSGEAAGAFFSFMTAFLLAYEPAKRLARLNIDLNSALVGVRALQQVIDGKGGEDDDSDRPALTLSDTQIEARGLVFRYGAREAVLRGLSFTAEPGRVTALVGPSGGGKSTVFNLILRFHEPQSGSIVIGGEDLAGVSRASVRRQIAYVGQDVFLFRGTVRENIGFGRPGASEAEIVAAAKAAFAHDFIAAFPQGYDTPVGEHGLALSGGQRQRIAIARALMKDAPIILLDEATAALDSESERQVQEAVAGLCAGRTTLVIAHRLSTIMHADAIHVIEDGRVVESGRHDDLMRRGGRYASFYRLQLQGQHGAHEPDPRSATGG